MTDKEGRIVSVSFPIPDTQTGPGTYQVEMELMDEQSEEIPMVKIHGSIEHLGRGSAQDISSLDNTLDPFEED